MAKILVKILTSRWIHTLILLGLLVSVLSIRMQDYSWIKSLRYLAFDAYNQITPRPQTNHVIIVDIDETSLERDNLGQWPWSRDVLAVLVNQLSAMGASAIVFDMVFAEHDRTSPQALRERIPAKEQYQEVRDLLETMPNNDAVFSQAIKNSNRVVTAFIWAGHKNATRQAPILSQPILLAKQARDLTKTVPHMTGVATNISTLSMAAAGNGCFGVSPEIDGIIRRVPLLFSFYDPAHPNKDDKAVLYPSLALEALRVSQGAKTMIKTRTLKTEEIGLFDPPLLMNIGRYDLPLDWDGQFFIYFSKERSDQYIPAWKIIEDQIKPESIKDKIVLIGTSAEGLKDIRSTPLNLFIPGVEVHANVIEQIITGDFLHRPKTMDGIEFMTIIFIGCIIIMFAPFIGALYMALFTAILIIAITFTSWYLFQIHGVLLDPVYTSLCLLVFFSMSSLLSYMRTESERKHVRDAFGFYISPEFMTELTKNPGKLKLGGDTKELTVMFTDIRNFTSISETMSPEDLIHLMNDFLTPMSDLVMHNRGTIDKYMGDAMMAFWNAPLDDHEHARHACQTALQMNKALIPINESLRQKALENNHPAVFLEAGIGINTGQASVGNMGSKQRFAYSALGDTVNLASRLEGQTKQYGVRILIGEQTKKQIPMMAALELDLIRVKGKKDPERIFVLLGDEDMANSSYFKDWEEKHNAMITAYRAQEWDQARKLADQCREIAKDGMVIFYYVFMDRLALMKKNPPKAGWNGVFIAENK